MSVNALDLEQSAINNSNIGLWDYTKEVLANRPYHFFDTIRFSAEVLGKGLGVANAALAPIYVGLGRLVSTENLVFFFQGVVATPEEAQKLCNKVTGWWNGSTAFLGVANQARKFSGHIAATVGDYVDGCSALEGLGVNITKINVISARIGSIGSALGAISRIGDYMSGDVASKAPHKLAPSLEKVRQPIAESKDLWNLGKDVSIFALSALCLVCGGFAAVPAILAVGLPGSILGTRMVAFYREVQLKAIDASYPQIAAAKKVLKTS